MNKIIFSAVVLLISSLSLFGKDNNHEINKLKNTKLILVQQIFVSHDKEGTNIDTVKHEGDFILFAENGKAYMQFNGKNDSIEYHFINNSVSFGDTPFIITNIGNGYFSLFQNEETANGDYNRVTYLLKQEEDKKLSYSK